MTPALCRSDAIRMQICSLNFVHQTPNFILVRTKIDFKINSGAGDMGLHMSITFDIYANLFVDFVQQILDCIQVLFKNNSGLVTYDPHPQSSDKSPQHPKWRNKWNIAQKSKNFYFFYVQKFFIYKLESWRVL